MDVKRVYPNPQDDYMYVSQKQNTPQVKVSNDRKHYNRKKRKRNKDEDQKNEIITTDEGNVIDIKC